MVLTPNDLANIDEHEDFDDETTGNLHREISEAELEEQQHPQGRPGSFLNRLISHGNKKTEDQLSKEAAAAHNAAMNKQSSTG